MKEKGTGGANTNKSGLPFEKDKAFSSYVSMLNGYRIELMENPKKSATAAYRVYREDKLIGKIVPKARFYEFLQDELKITITNSKKWQPDEAFIHYESMTVYIVEKKYQKGAGSVDEKILGFGNKRRLYQRLLDQVSPTYSVNFVFIGNSEYWGNDKFKDSFEMLRRDGIKIMLDEYDMKYFGLY